MSAEQIHLLMGEALIEGFLMAKAMHIRKDDSVVVTAGKDKGKTGRVIRTEPARRRVFVEGLNMVKRHTRPRSVKDTQKAQSSGIIEKEGPIDVSNVMLLDPTDNKPTRVGVRAGDDGVRHRYREANRQGPGVATPMEAATVTDTQRAAPPPRLRETYENELVGKLTERFGYTSPMEVPRLVKITLNMGVGDAKQATPVLEAATEQLATIAGQRPNVRRARKSIASFKVREGMPVGVSVTLRGARMWEFLDRLVSIAIPRIRDFRGLSARAFDGRGNYSLGVREQLIFPEIDYDSIDEVRGLDVAITTTAATDEEAFELLFGLGMPFAQEGRPGAVDTAAEEEEERRKEEARRRAEAEQAALEQLKEENPEAYAKRERHDEEEEGEGEGEGDAAPEGSGDSDEEGSDG